MIVYMNVYIHVYIPFEFGASSLSYAGVTHGEGTASLRYNALFVGGPRLRPLRWCVVHQKTSYYSSLSNSHSLSDYTVTREEKTGKRGVTVKIGLETPSLLQWIFFHMHKCSPFRGR